MKDMVTPALPCQTVPIKPEKLEGARPFYQMMPWKLRKLRCSPSLERPGVDRPEQATALYASADEWLLTGNWP